MIRPLIVISLAAALAAPLQASDSHPPSARRTASGEVVIRGKVVDHRGEPRTGGVVDLVRGPVSPLVKAYPGYAELAPDGLERLEEDGSFELRRKVADGRHLVKALVDEGDNLRVAIGEIVVKNGRCKPVTLSLGEPVELRGRVIDTARRPVAKVPLAITAVPPPELGGEGGLRRPSPGTHFHVESGADGSFVFTPVDPGRYAVYPVGARWQMTDTPIVHAGDKATLIVRRKPILRATVVDSTGAPIPIFQARVDGQSEGAFRAGTLELALGRRRHGAGMVVLEAPGLPRYTVPQSIELGSSDDLDLGTLSLPAGRSLKLVVGGLSGVAPVLLNRKTGEQEDRLAIRVFSRSASESGLEEEPRPAVPEGRRVRGGLRYELTGLPEGPVRLLLEAPDRVPLFLEVPVDQQAGRVVLRPAPILEITVVDGKGEPLAEVSAYLRQALEGEPFSRSGRTDARGRLRLSGALPGEGQLRLSRRGERPREETVTLPTRGVHRQRFVLGAEEEKAPKAP